MKGEALLSEVQYSTIESVCTKIVLSNCSTKISSNIPRPKVFVPKHVLLLQWNPSKTDTIGTNDFVRCSKVSLAQGLVVDHAPPIIAANYDCGRRKDHIDENSVD